MTRREKGSARAAVATGLALLIPGVGLVGTPPAAASNDRCHTMIVVAHRGVTQHGVVENTLRAMQAAIDRGLGFEMDVRTLADGRLVVVHDARWNRTTTGSGAVADTTSAKLRRIRTDDGQAVPYVDTALRLVRDNPGTRVVLDLKRLSRGGLQRLAATIAELGIADQVSAISFRDRLIRGFRTGNPGLPTFRILSYLPTPEKAASYGGVSVWGALVTDAWVASMQQAGVPFTIRVNDDPRLWELAATTGARWVMTDDVDGYAAYCQASDPSETPGPPGDPEPL